MAIGERKSIKGAPSLKVFESVMINPHGRAIRLDIWKTDQTDVNDSIFVFCANDFIQTYDTDKTLLLVELAAYMVDNL